MSLFEDLHKKTFNEKIEAILDEYNNLMHNYLEVKDKLDNYNKDKEIKNLNDEIEDIRKRSLLVMSEEETKREKAFRDKHYEKCHNGSNYIYDLKGTGVGCIITIKCPVCNEEEDITDMESW